MLARRVNSTTVRRTRRSGLAPLELVLALPLMMCVLALIMNFGNAAVWKTRAQTANRLVIWRSRPGFNVGSDPDPVNLVPSQYSLRAMADSPLTTVYPVWKRPEIWQDFMTSTTITAPGGGVIHANDLHCVDIAEGMGRGEINLTQRFPFLPSTGNIHYLLQHNLVDSNWQFDDRAYAYNDSRRSEPWYHWLDAPEWSSQRQRFVNADQAIRNYQDRERLKPLDRDEELINRGYPFDFYPRADNVCSDDVQSVLQNHILNRGGLVDRIQGSNGTEGLVERMARTFLRMYQDELRMLQAMMNPPAGRIAQLQQWITELNDLLSKIP